MNVHGSLSRLAERARPEGPHLPVEITLREAGTHPSPEARLSHPHPARFTPRYQQRRLRYHRWHLRRVPTSGVRA